MSRPSRKRWIIEIGGEYWVEFKTRPMGRWTKSIALATPVPWSRANTYVRDWRPYGARKVRTADARPGPRRRRLNPRVTGGRRR